MSHWYYPNDLYNRWDNPGNNYISDIQKMSEFAVKRGINVMQILNPVWVEGHEKGGEKKIRCSSQEDLDKLFKVYKLSLDKGSRIVSFFFDDFVSTGDEKGQLFLTQPEDRKFFEGNIGKAHCYALKELSERVKKDFPDCEITFLPGPYQDIPGPEHYYFKEFKDAPPDTIFHWTGPSPGNNAVSLSYTEEQCKNYQSGIGGRRFVIHDNAPGHLHTTSGVRMFDLYAEKYDGLWKYCYGIQAMVGFSPVSELMNYDAIMAAEYMWNAENYQPELSRRKILAVMAGRDAIEYLLVFREIYFRILEEYVEKKPPYPLEERVNNLKMGMEVMKKSLEEIKKNAQTQNW
ncbi:MAG: beta-N-acetylglucosaminidase domain-containing protein [Candidatus Omnitrophota bacterium]